MIHWITRSSREADSWPFAQELHRLDPEIRFILGEIPLRYRRKIFFVLLGYPRLFLFGVMSAIKSISADPHPCIVVLESDVELIAYKLIQVIFRYPRITTVLTGFIFVSHRNPVVTGLKTFYYKRVLKLASIVIVHSSREIELYGKRFPLAAEKFVHVPYGIGAPRGKVEYACQPRAGYLLSAGRSCRDYRTLIDAVQKTPFKLRIVCDSLETLPNSWLSQQVTADRRCYGDDYIDRIFEAEIVCIPLREDDVSAGQMVLLHAMAYRKPIIVTDTPTVRDYVHYSESVVLVPPKEPAAMRAAIMELMASEMRREALAARAGQNFEHYHTTEMMARAIYYAIKDRAKS